MSLIERAWRDMPADEFNRMTQALLAELDEDDAMSAVQVMRGYVVPAASLRGAVARLERAETLLRELCHREGNPRAVRRTMDGVREFVDLPRLGGR